MTPTQLVFCSWCGSVTPMDYVHGHAQCVHCKTNVAPCCDGASDCAAPKDDPIRLLPEDSVR